jgi:zinc protease
MTSSAWSIPLLVGLTAAGMRVPPNAPTIDRTATPSSERRPESFRLSNGLTVVIERLPNVPLVTVRTEYRVGAADDPPGRRGMAHLAEHVMYGGTPHVSASVFTSRLVAVGGGSNAVTSRDRTVYATWAVASATELAIYLEAERMAFAVQTPTDSSVALARRIVAAEFRTRVADQPRAQAFAAVAQHLYAGTSYGNAPTGIPDDLASVSVEEVRHFLSQHYGPDNAFVTIVGDVDEARVRAMVEKWFGPVPRNQTVRAALPALPPAAASVAQLEASVAQTQLYKGWRVPGALSEENLTFDVLAGLLSDRSTGSLRDRLVDRARVATDVSALYEPHDSSSDFYLVVTARAGVPLTVVDSTLTAALDSLAIDPPDSLSIRRVVNRIRMQRLRDTESTGGRADWLGECVNSKRADCADDGTRPTLPVSQSDVQRALRDYLAAGPSARVGLFPAGKTEPDFARLAPHSSPQ